MSWITGWRMEVGAGGVVVVVRGERMEGRGTEKGGQYSFVVVKVVSLLETCSTQSSIVSLTTFGEVLVVVVVVCVCMGVGGGGGDEGA